ncbi:hypothetical protein OSTOST_22900, partial [Ostertagia ostertagi]
NPVITPGGYLFDREAILEYILAQKKDIAKRTKEWEKQNAINEEELKKAQKSDHDAAARKFAEVEGTPAHPGYKSSVDEAREGSSNPLKRPGSAITVQPPQKVKALGIEGDISNMKGERSKQLPITKKFCAPLSGKPLKMKDLMEVKFTLMPNDDDQKSIIAAKVAVILCSLLIECATNTSRCASLKKSKSVVTWDVVEKLIRKDWTDPVNGEPMSEETYRHASKSEVLVMQQPMK